MPDAFHAHQPGVDHVPRHGFRQTAKGRLGDDLRIAGRTSRTDSPCLSEVPQVEDRDRPRRARRPARRLRRRRYRPRACSTQPAALVVLVRRRQASSDRESSTARARAPGGTPSRCGWDPG